MDSDDIETVGLPDFWEQAHDVNSAAFQAIAKLHPLQAELFSKPVAEPLHKVILMVAEITYNSLGALTTLLLNGYGRDGMKIARSMYEASITTSYLKNNPCELADYLDYGHILNKLYLDYLKQKGRDVAGAQQVEIEYQRVLPRFKKKAQRRPRSRWCRKNIHDMATEVGAKDLYRTFYRMASSLHHGDVSSLANQIDQTSNANMGLSLRWIDDALLMGHGSVVTTLTDYNEIAGHGMNEQVDRAGEAFERAWGSIAQA